MRWSHKARFITAGSRAHRHDVAPITRRVVLEDGVWLTAQCIVMGRSRVRKSAVVTPGSVIDGEGPAGAIFDRQPGMVVGRHFRDSAAGGS